MHIKLKSNQSQKFLLEGYMALTLLYVHALVRYAIFHSVGSDAYSLPHNLSQRIRRSHDYWQENNRAHSLNAGQYRL